MRDNGESYLKRHLLYIPVIAVIIIAFNIFDISRYYQNIIIYVLLALSVLVDIIYEIKNKEVIKSVLIFNLLFFIFCLFMIFR
ncbi:hypothetical protein D3C76_1494620 [compost metagenome]